MPSIDPWPLLERFTDRRLGLERRVAAALPLCREGGLDALAHEERGFMAMWIAYALNEPGSAVPEEGEGKLARAGINLVAARLLRACLASESAGPLEGAALAALEGVALETLGGPALTAALSAPLAAPGGGGLGAALEDLLLLSPGFTASGHQRALTSEDVAIWLCALAFSRDRDAYESFCSGMDAFAAVRPDGRLDEGERAALWTALSDYIEGSTTRVFAFGKWPATAEAAAGALRHSDAVATWLGPEGTLRGEPPTLGVATLTRAQADWFAVNLDLVADGGAAGRLSAAVARLSGWTPGPTLAPTAFYLLARVHDQLRNRVEGSPDRLDYRALDAALAQAGGELEQRLAAALAALAGPAPAVGAVSIPASEARWWAELLRSRVRSDRAIDSLATALKTWIGDGDAASAEDIAGFRAFLEGYFAQWPGSAVFDFNKLDRMAAAARGEAGAICLINGEPVEPGRFHVAVGEAVAAAASGVDFHLRWVPHRFGYRAKQAVELVDLFAEQLRAGKGPLATLHASAEGGAVSVLGTTSDMEYNLLIFKLDRQGQPAELYYMDSDGALHPRYRHPERKHLLFEALVDEDARVDVRIPSAIPLSLKAYPLMNPYGVGDRVDLEFVDRAASEVQREKERFETLYKVVQATITAFDHKGFHTVSFVDPEGAAQTREVSYEVIRQANNPHVVREDGDSACTVSFNRHRDPHLKTDLEAMEAIAREVGLLGFPLSLDEVALARLQKRFLKALNAFTATTMRYPRSPPVDDADQRYHDRLSTGTHPAGEYLAIARGVCRHQFVREHMGKQRAGIDERFASGAANTYGGDFRGLHIWGEVSLADRARLIQDNREPADTRYLSDPTWHDPYIPLWDGAYGNDSRRIEMYRRTGNYARHLALG